MAGGPVPTTATFRTPEDASLVKKLGATRDAALDRELELVVSRLPKPQRPAAISFIANPAGSKPRQGGWHDQDEHFVASMAKLALGVAACQLRDDLRASADLTKARTLRDAWTGLKAHWAGSPSSLVQRLARMRDSALPRYARVFDVSFNVTGLPSDLDFDADSPAQRNGAFTDADFADLQKLNDGMHGVSNAAAYKILVGRRFLDVLHLALRWSNNWAASACLDVLTVNYVMTCLAQLGLFAPGAQRGLHLGGWYAGPVKPMSIQPVSVPVVKDSKGNVASKEFTPRSSQASSAAAAATLMACLSKGLVVPGAAPMFRSLLDNINGDNYLTNGMYTPVTPPATEHLSKIGIFGDHRWHDAVAVTGLDSGGKDYSFALCVVGSDGPVNLKKVGNALLPWAQREGFKAP